MSVDGLTGCLPLPSLGMQSGKALKSLLSGSFSITFLAALPTFAQVANFRFPHGVRREFAYTIRVPQEILPVVKVNVEVLAPEAFFQYTRIQARTARGGGTGAQYYV